MQFGGVSVEMHNFTEGLVAPVERMSFVVTVTFCFTPTRLMVVSGSASIGMM